VTVLEWDERSRKSSQPVDLTNGLLLLNFNFGWDEIPVSPPMPHSSEQRGQPVNLWLDVFFPQKNPVTGQSPQLFDDLQVG
jgi:hypothetical protein